MITKLFVKMSLIGLVVENIEIEDLILVLSPDASKAMNYDSKNFDGEMKRVVLKHMIQNYELMRSGSKLQPLSKVQGIHKDLLTTKQAKDTSLKTPFMEKGPIDLKRDKDNNMV